MSTGTNGSDARVRLALDHSLLEHEERFDGAPRHLIVGHLHRPIYYALGDHGQCLASALRKRHHELNDTLYFTLGALFVNTTQLVVALVAPAHWLAAACVVAYAWYVLALVPFALHWFAAGMHAMPLYWLMPVLRWSGLALTLAYVALLVVWSAFSGVSWRLRVAFAALQLVTCVLQFTVVVALVNIEGAFYGWLSAYRAMQNLQCAAATQPQRERMTDAGRRVGDMATARVGQPPSQQQQQPRRRSPVLHL
jgi:hypothetical protein